MEKGTILPIDQIIDVFNDALAERFSHGVIGVFDGLKYFDWFAWHWWENIYFIDFNDLIIFFPNKSLNILHKYKYISFISTMQYHISKVIIYIKSHHLQLFILAHHTHSAVLPCEWVTNNSLKLYIIILFLFNILILNVWDEWDSIFYETPYSALSYSWDQEYN